MLRTACLFFVFICGLTAEAQWMLDESWSSDGRKVDASDRWEVPVALSQGADGVVMLCATYDAEGEVRPRWRGLSTWGGLSWEGEGNDGERPVDLVHGFLPNRWFMLSEAPDPEGDTLASVLRVRAFEGNSPVESWGEEGVVNMSFIGPAQEGGAIHAHIAGGEGPEVLDDWVAIAGAGYDSCCAHQEMPALALVSAFNGSWHPDFGAEGRVVLDPDGWQVEDSVRHTFSGRFESVLFVPWNLQSNDPQNPENLRILAGGTYALSGAFRPFLAMFRFDGSLETEFGDGGIMTWMEDGNLNHGVRALRHRWEWLGPSFVVEVLIGVPEGESTLSGGTLSLGTVPLWPEPGLAPLTAPIEPGLPTTDPVRAVGIGAGFGWKLEDEIVAVGTLVQEAGWNGAQHPVWWTGPNTSFGGVDAYWTEDTEYPSQRAGAVMSQGGKLYIAGTLPGDGPSNSSWIISRWREDPSSIEDFSMQEALPFPNPTAGMIHWECPAGTVICWDVRGRILAKWAHPGGRFTETLPTGAAWLGRDGYRGHPVRRLD